MKKNTLEPRVDLSEAQALLRQGDVARMIDMSEAWLERMRWLGSGIRFIKVGRSVRYRLSDVQNYLSSRNVEVGQ